MSDVATASTPLMNVLLPVMVGGLIAIVAGLVSGLVGPYVILRVKDRDREKTEASRKM